MAGTLTIHSNGDGSIMSGHSWITYQPDGGPPTTYGTWGNNPGGLGNGLHRDLEAGRASDVSRSVHLTDDQEKALMAKIKEYEDKGEKGWGHLSPCSTFAADAWKAGTGESLSHRSGIISNPSKLKVSIDTANGVGPVSPPPAIGRPSSSSFLRSPVQQCIAPDG